MTRREFVGAVAAAPLARNGKPSAFRRSDVVFGFAFTTEEYRQWHGTVLFGWTQGPRSREDLPKFIEQRRQAVAAGMRAGTALNALALELPWYRERDPHWQDALWRNLKGQLLAEPWVRPPDPFPPEQGRICAHHPLYMGRKLELLELGLSLGPDAIHIDDPLATATALSRGGCFCKHCVTGFREYLKKDALFDPTEQLRAPDSPLWREFHNYQLRYAVENVKRFFARARELRPSILVGANAHLQGPHIVFAPYLDYLCAEVGTDAKALKFGAKPLLNYRLGEAFGVAVAATGMYMDWAMLTVHDIPDLVRGWVAESYAMGGNFIVPHKEWSFVQPPGKLPQRTAYPARVELIGPLYEFVRTYPELFDGYEALTQAALLYDYRAARERNAPRYDAICLELANANVQFGMLVAGSEPLDWELKAEELERYPVVIVPEPSKVEGRQRELLERWERKGRVVRWRGPGSVKLPPLVTAEPGGGKVWAFPRANRDTLVCHVLNREFDPKAERLTPQKSVTVRLDKKLFDRRKARRCRMFMEKQPPRELPVRATRGAVEVTIPELELWAVLRFD